MKKVKGGGRSLGGYFYVKNSKLTRYVGCYGRGMVLIFKNKLSGQLPFVSAFFKQGRRLLLAF